MYHLYFTQNTIYFDYYFKFFKANMYLIYKGENTKTNNFVVKRTRKNAENDMK